LGGLSVLPRHRQDAALPENRNALASISAAGHEIGNHSFHHEPWLHLYSEAEVEAELTRAADAIEKATGCRPIGFRGPGFSLSPTVLRVLARLGYRYDCSTFPTFLGPLARAYYFMTAKGLNPEEKARRSQLFGSIREGFRPLRPYRWATDEGDLVEIPVTTMPMFRVPIHVSYLLYLGTVSSLLALAYWRSALALCRLTRTAPSLLLHPLDFLGREDAPELGFFPAMGGPAGPKLALVERVLNVFARSFRVVPMEQHASEASSAELSVMDSAPTPSLRPLRQSERPVSA
jgi:hypothetical protein